MGRHTNHHLRYKNSGRKTVMTPDILQKLEDAFMFTYSDEEACLYAGISPTTLYTYQLKNPQFKERKEALKLTPNLQAKKELVEGIKGNLGQARWWVEKKVPEFAPKLLVQGKVTHEHVLTPEMQASIEAYRRAKREHIINNIKAIQ